MLDPGHPVSLHNPTTMPEYACKDIDGNPIRVRKAGQEAAYAHFYWMNLLDPYWQDFLSSHAKRLIDNGVQGVVMEVPVFNQRVIFSDGGTFDEYSMN